jgi:hypothetical protein
VTDWQQETRGPIFDLVFGNRSNSSWSLMVTVPHRPLWNKHSAHLISSMRRLNGQRSWEWTPREKAEYDDRAQRLGRLQRALNNRAAAASQHAR